VNVVVPQPLSAGDARVPNVKNGKTSKIVSGVDTCNGEFNAKMKETEDETAIIGFAITKLSLSNDDVTNTTIADPPSDAV